MYVFAEGGHISGQLKQVQLPFVNYNICQHEYTGEIKRHIMVCAGHAGIDTCQGDSGQS